MTAFSRFSHHLRELWEAHERHSIKQALGMLPPDLYRDVIRVREAEALTHVHRKMSRSAHQRFSPDIAPRCECEAF